MDISFSEHSATLNLQLKKNGLYCSDLILQAAERNRKSSNQLFRSHMITMEELDLIRSRILAVMKKNSKAH